jgi:hypothetical protein
MHHSKVTLHSLITIFCQAFQLVDKGPFRRFIQYCRPALSERNIPHRTKVREEIMKCAETVIERAKANLEVFHLLSLPCWHWLILLYFSRRWIVRFR